MAGTDAVIRTPRLILRHFVEADLEPLAQLMANSDFMRFSTGVFTREQAASFLFERLIAPAREGLPSQFALIPREENRLLGYCGFFQQVADGRMKSKSGTGLIPLIGTADWLRKQRTPCGNTRFEF